MLVLARLLSRRSTPLKLHSRIWATARPLASYV